MFTLLRRRSVALTAIAALALATAGLVHHKAQSDYDTALQHFRTTAHDDTLLTVRNVSGVLDRLYENLRTLSLLSSVRRIDRHGETLTADGRQAIQQVFNNLAADVSVSEVYVVPAELDPEKIDAKTSEPEAPTLMIDKVRMGLDAAAEPDEPRDPALPPTEEIYEYRALKTHMAEMAALAPSLAGLQVSDIRFGSIAPLITCDNSVFDKTRVDADRTGPIFTVPYYGEDNRFRGVIAAILLNSAVSNLLPAENFALLDTRSHAVFGSAQGGQQQLSAASVSAQSPDPDLIYSEVIPLQSASPDAFVKLWVGLPNSKFFGSVEYLQSRRFALTAYAAVIIIALLTVATSELIRASFERAHAAEIHLAQRLDERTRALESATATQAQERERAEAARRMAEAEAIAGERQMLTRTVGEGLARLSRRDMTYRLGLDLPESYSKLRNDFNASADSLAVAITQVREAVASLRLESDDLATGSQDLAARSTQQKQGLDAAVGSLGQMRSAGDRMALEVKAALDAVKAARNDADRSEEVVARSLSAMHLIEVSSKKIGAIIVVIDEIAFQTSLLALNAGVEAARAGDAGRGFAVLAQEVRELARKSAQAGREINALIVQSSGYVSEGVDLVAQAGAALRRIGAKVQAADAAMERVGREAQAQGQRVKQTDAAISDVGVIIGENADTACQAANSCAQLARRADELGALVQSFVCSAEAEALAA